MDLSTPPFPFPTWLVETDAGDDRGIILPFDAEEEDDDEDGYGFRNPYGEGELLLPRDRDDGPTIADE